MQNIYFNGSFDDELGSKYLTVYTNCIIQEKEAFVNEISASLSPSELNFIEDVINLGRNFKYGNRLVDEYYFSHALRIARFVYYNIKSEYIPYQVNYDEIYNIAVESIKTQAGTEVTNYSNKIKLDQMNKEVSQQNDNITVVNSKINSSEKYVYYFANVNNAISPNIISKPNINEIIPVDKRAID
jgi:hypothetical protein